MDVVDGRSLEETTSWRLLGKRLDRMIDVETLFWLQSRERGHNERDGAVTEDKPERKEGKEERKGRVGGRNGLKRTCFFSIAFRLSSSNRLSCRFRPISNFDISPKPKGQSRGVWAVLEEEEGLLWRELELGPADGRRESEPTVGRGRMGSKTTIRSESGELGACLMAAGG
jgi:hypothetical protein